MSDKAERRQRSLTDLTRTRVEKNENIVALKAYTDQKQLDDPFKDTYGDVMREGDLALIEPTYSFYSLMKLPTENSMLQQCIAAMVTNIDGHGHRLMYVGPEGQEESSEALAEKQNLENLFNYPNDDYSFQELRTRIRRDYETLGNAYIEVGRDSKGHIVMLSHVPAHTLRMTVRDRNRVEVEVNVPRDGKPTSKVGKRFRRFVQNVNNRKVYFKEFGDPRIIDPNTGLTSVSLTLENSATEIYHFSQYTPGSAYGMPRWFHQLPAIMGGRQAELTNLEFFKDNAIPAALVFVSGGLLTDESIESIEAYFSQARGRQSMNRVAVIEAQGDPSTAPESGAVPIPKVEMRTLTGERQGDALFQQYEKNNEDKVRSAFRLPPLYVGQSGDYTYATAKTSFEVAEGQVFGPERAAFDEVMNQKIVSSFKAKYWAFRSQPQRLASREDILKALSNFERVGALTPNVTIGLCNEFFDLEIKPVGEAWGDYPFELVKLMVQTGQVEPSMFPGLEEHLREPETPEVDKGAGIVAGNIDDESKTTAANDDDEPKAATKEDTDEE